MFGIAKLAATATTTRGRGKIIRPPSSDSGGPWDAGLTPEGREKSRNIMGNRLYIGNLSFQVTTESLREAFTPYGEVTDVHVVTDRDSGQSRGFGFVTMGSDQEAKNAMTSLDGSMIDGRALRVNEAEERQQRGGRGGRGGGGGGGRW
jgi:RNA recognition motif-containing protein